MTKKMVYIQGAHEKVRDWVESEKVNVYALPTTMIDRGCNVEAVIHASLDELVTNSGAEFDVQICYIDSFDGWKKNYKDTVKGTDIAHWVWQHLPVWGYGDFAVVFAPAYTNNNVKKACVFTARS